MRPERVILNSKSPLIKTPAWMALLDHFERVKQVHMVDLFDQDPERFSRYSLEFNEMLLDYSKNRVTDVTMQLLFDLARQANVEEFRDKMLSGDKINNTEGRAVLPGVARCTHPDTHPRKDNSRSNINPYSRFRIDYRILVKSYDD